MDFTSAYRPADEGIDWTLDIWAVDQPERQPDLNHLRTLLPRLDVMRLWDRIRVVKEEDRDLFVRLLSDIHRAVWAV